VVSYSLLIYLQTVYLEIRQYHGMGKYKTIKLSYVVELENIISKYVEKENLISSHYSTFRISDEQLFKRRHKLHNFALNSYVKLAPYTNDVQGYLQHIEELKTYIFKFKPEDMKKAKTIFQDLKNTYRSAKKGKVGGDITMISIHVRLTDYKQHLKNIYGMEYNAKAFLTKAMTYCINKYQVT
jgi:hypothetical protein